MIAPAVHSDSREPRDERERNKQREWLASVTEGMGRSALDVEVMASFSQIPAIDLILN